MTNVLKIAHSVLATKLITAIRVAASLIEMTFVDGLCPECYEEYFYCEECGGQIFEDEYYEYDGRCEDCYKSFDE